MEQIQVIQEITSNVTYREKNVLLLPLLFLSNMLHKQKARSPNTLQDITG